MNQETDYGCKVMERKIDIISKVQKRFIMHYITITGTPPSIRAHASFLYSTWRPQYMHSMLNIFENCSKQKVNNHLVHSHGPSLSRPICHGAFLLQ